MKSTLISNLQIKPETYAEDVYYQVDWECVESEMSEGERKFVNGLIQYYQPENVLELGVSAGGGTICLLNALQNLPRGVLYSIDNSVKYNWNSKVSTGYCAKLKYSELLDKSWHLMLGQDPSAVMEKLDCKFDFCVIDTSHLHPTETLNFISVLPFLNDGAVVVLHDTTMYAHQVEYSYLRYFAPRFLFSAVCAEKYVPKVIGWTGEIPNIAAFQVNSNTRKYCRNLFDELYLPWKIEVPDDAMTSMRTLVSKYYGDEMLACFDEAVKMNRSLLLDDYFGTMNFLKQYERMNPDTVFYGAGAEMRKLLRILDTNKVNFKFQIWDRDAERIGKIGEHIVLPPKPDEPAASGQTMIVTIKDDRTFGEVRKKYEALGYMVHHRLEECFAD